MDLNKKAKEIHGIHKKWWEDPHTGKPIERNNRELLMLAVSEISEAMEGERKDLMDDHLTHRKMGEVEMADAAIRLFDYAGGYKIKLNKGSIYFDITDNKGEFLFYIVQEIVVANTPSGEQISDALAAIEEYCKNFGYDLYGAIDEKLEYNKHRADHKHENRIKEGGKKF